MEMYNADGSRGEMCGNGIRCVAKYVYDHGLSRNPMRVETDAGIKALRLHVAAAGSRRSRSTWASPILEGPRIPVAARRHVVDAPLEVAGRPTGSPACRWAIRTAWSFVPDVEAWIWSDRPALRASRVLPEAGQHRVRDRAVAAELRMRVWERGSGETAACGTGACAALVAAVLTGRAEREATVHLPGGDLEIDWQRTDGHVYMNGPAEEVFRGEIEV